MRKNQKESRIPGFHKKSRIDRISSIADWINQPQSSLVEQLNSGGINPNQAALMIENVLGTYSLPFAVAPNFLVNGNDMCIPMVVEEASVVAAAANAARLARSGGGFTMTATDPIMICQIQLFGVDLEKAAKTILAKKMEILSSARQSDPPLNDAGGGPCDIEIRSISGDPDHSFLVVHLLVDVRDAMGANSVNTMGEAITPLLERLTGGQCGLRILSNLADKRIITGELTIPLQNLDMEDYSAEDVRNGIINASKFAELDPYRAATHNKGIMNGIDAVLLATGNDWRAVEAGAHAFASLSGRYKPLCTWQKDDQGNLAGKLKMPMAVGIVGGTTRTHRNARLALDILGVDTANELSMAIGAAGMASNLAALRALATEGIQQGHMRLHERSRKLDQ